MLSELLHIIDEEPGYQRLVKELELSSDDKRVTVLEAAKPFLITALYRRLNRPMIVVTSQPDSDRKLYEQILTWCSSGEIRLLPEPDSMPYERVTSDTPYIQEKLQALSSLVGWENGGPTEEPPLVVTSAQAFIQKTASKVDFNGCFHKIEAGMEIDPVELLKRWQAIGYRIESIVEMPGMAGRRGGILDIYPPTSEMPVRLEFFGNTVESIRLYDPDTQRSQQDVPSIIIGPATEILLPFLGNNTELDDIFDSVDLTSCNDDAKEQFKQDLTMLRNSQRPANIQFYASLFNSGSLLDYLPDNTVLILDEPRNVELSIMEFHEKSEELRDGRVERGELPAGFPRPYFTWEELKRPVEERQRLLLSTWSTPDDSYTWLDFISAPSYAGQLPSFLVRVKQMLLNKQRVIIISHQASRLSELLGEEEIIAAPVTEIKHVPPPGSLTLVQGLLDGGWTMSDNTVLFTDAEIFGFIKQQRSLKKRPVPRHKLVLDIKPGDYVVHIEHGIAEFIGFRMMRTEYGEKEFLILRYAAGDRLYVPTDQIDRVSRYVGGSGDHIPTLTRLGTQEWTRTKEKIKKSVEEMAEELLALYAARNVVPGFAFSPDTLWQQELEASFPYVETPDQIEVQKQVKADMERDKPMDRLVCGDVGYGKTEVAIRAAFKAMLDGKQVAVLVPTTVLAQQHYSTFKERFEAFPLVIEVLSRFRTQKEQEEIVEGLDSGRVDICIGTHRLLQKDVHFKDLGLLIIDEEQRFGVTHKEYLKKMRQEVDVLTLSATPIPRTIHMALTGVRDMSTIETPPEERLPIKTYVAEYDERLIREAILREMERNGQVFFVHNRVQSIPFVANQLGKIVPEARVAIAHGQMPEHELERVTSDFVIGKSDVLLCTTIIESGLDMPNVNTLIVNRADRFGLTQLYQLRGRVGRGARLAYTYFLFDRGQKLTPVAEQRLRTIYEATELGAGFSIAMKDLEIRGAGTLLGTKQSGHISAVGFHLYTQLLASTVEKMKAKQAGIPEEEIAPLQLPPMVDLPLPAFIPEEYVPDLITRLGLYEEIARMDRLEQIDIMIADFKDRFGMPPPEVENLLYAVRVKILASRAFIESVTTERGEIVLRMVEGMRFDKHKLKDFIRDGIRIGINQVGLNRKRMGKEWRDVMVDVLKRLG